MSALLFNACSLSLPLSLLLYLTSPAADRPCPLCPRRYPSFDLEDSMVLDLEVRAVQIGTI